MPTTTPSRSDGTQKRRIELAFGPVTVVFNPPLIHVMVTEPSRETFERLGPPRVFQGDRAQHLTIPLEPLPRGPTAGKLNIHLTYGAGSKSFRHTVALVAPDEVQAAIEPAAMALVRHFIRVTQRVMVEDLRAQGFWAVLPSETAEAWAIDHAERLRWKLRITEARLERAGQEFEWYDLAVLDELRDDPNHKTVMLVDDSEQKALFVTYHSEGLGPTKPPGWYAFPLNENCFKGILDEAMVAALRPAFFEALLEIARELQADVDVTAIEQALARAQGMSVPASHVL